MSRTTAGTGCKVAFSQDVANPRDKIGAATVKNRAFPPHPQCQDISACRASRCGGSDLVFCLNDKRKTCGYTLSFGDKYFCRHPQSMEIAARSKVS